MRLYIIRHGETAWNQELRLQGQTDIALNENGRSLAQVTARALQDVPFDLAVTSPLARARETAELVLGEQLVPIFEDKRIQEISFGVCEGCRVKNAAGEVTSPVLRNFFQKPECYKAPEGAESLDELCARTGAFLDELKLRRDLYGKTILISTHGAASRALLSHIKKSSRAEFWDTGVPKNCAVTVVELADVQETAGEDSRFVHQETGGERDWHSRMAESSSPQWILIEQDRIYYENV